MKSAEVDFKFPVLGILENHYMEHFYNRDLLTRYAKAPWKGGWLTGMELIDAGGRKWVARSSRKIGTLGPPIIKFLFGWEVRLEHDVEPLPSVTLDEVRERVCKALEAAA